jgi:hypothetical protein
MYREDELIPVGFLKLTRAGFSLAGCAELETCIEELILFTADRTSADVVENRASVINRDVVEE